MTKIFGLSQNLDPTEKPHSMMVRVIISHKLTFARLKQSSVTWGGREFDWMQDRTDSRRACAYM